MRRSCCGVATWLTRAIQTYRKTSADPDLTALRCTAESLHHRCCQLPVEISSSEHWTNRYAAAIVMVRCLLIVFFRLVERAALLLLRRCSVRKGCGLRRAIASHSRLGLLLICGYPARLIASSAGTAGGMDSVSGVVSQSGWGSVWECGHRVGT